MASSPSAPDEQSRSLDKRWRIGAVAAIGIFVLISLVIGFWILPASQNRGADFDPFAAMCRAIGIPVFDRAARNPVTARTGSGTEVSWTADSRRLLADGNVARGAAVVTQVCGACHGKNGIAVTSIYPNLAHQSAAAIFKQLRDYKSSNRQGGQAAIMIAIAATLSEQQMSDVAAYYASQPDSKRVRVVAAALPEISRLATIGDPHRALPPCDACHGESRGGPEETPAIHGQSSAYLEQQLQAFAADQRRNDIFARMRNIAHPLTPDEMHGLAMYYGVAPVSR